MNTKAEKVLTSVKIQSDLFEEFKIMCVRYKYSFQKLADKIVNITGNEIEYIPNPYKSGYQLYTKANMYKIKKLYSLVYEENLKTIKIKKGVKMVYDYISRKNQFTSFIF